ncbi:MAG: hypothetical protein U9R25_04320 [Chloroflexota bacterium]|nr:hypothetical protein [Chloroflexota bacterium]
MRWGRETLPEADLAELDDLLQLTDLLQETLVPVAPEPAFRNELGTSLRLVARQRADASGYGRSRLTGRRKVAVAATASGVSVAVGLLTLVALYRVRSDTDSIVPPA